jgi:hypothetical protein
MQNEISLWIFDALAGQEHCPHLDSHLTALPFTSCIVRIWWVSIIPFRGETPSMNVFLLNGPVVAKFGPPVALSLGWQPHT